DDTTVVADCLSPLHRTAKIRNSWGLFRQRRKWHDGAPVAKLLGSVHMSASSPDPESSQSSSGYEDGLGRRVLAFDRETGEMLERLVLRPELSAFEAALKKRITIVAELEDERFARPRSIERDAHDRLTVVSEYVAGRRLSDLLDAAIEH